MANFENPYADDPGKARPVPGIVARQWAELLEWPLRFAGVHLYQHELDGLASFMGAVLRAYPKLLDKFTPQDDGDTPKK
jgi:hypothetical protein